MLLLLLLVIVLDEASAPICHFIKSIGKPLTHLVSLNALSGLTSTRLIHFTLIRLFPDVMGHEFVHR